MKKMKIAAVLILSFLGVVEFSSAFEMCSSTCKTSEDKENQLVNWVQGIEKKTLLEAKQSFEQIPERMNKKSIRNAFEEAKKRDNQLAMIVLANQFHILEGQEDTLANILAVNIALDEARGVLTEQLQGMMKTEVTLESVQLTTDSLEQQLHKVQQIVESVLTANLTLHPKKISYPLGGYVDALIKDAKRSQD